VTGGADRAGRGYWDEVWTGNVPQLRRLPDGRLRLTRVEQRFARLFRRLGALEGASGKRLLEIGSAGSTWLPWFAQEGFRVAGIDYSEPGCETARRLLDEAGVDGEVVHADALEPPTELLGAFDVVVSFGVVEHFEDTAGALRAFGRFLAPGGVLVTVVPNMTGVTGLTQRLVNRDVYAIHVPLDCAALAAAHRAAGLDARCRYFMSVNFGVPTLEGLDPSRTSTRVKRVALTALAQASKLVWLVEEPLRLPATRWLAPYVVCVAHAPAALGAA
jgi:2-polyprenyl-3-methyl-5-hydroxy-6-metoxy-1,4-benzoquinol methylase